MGLDLKDRIMGSFLGLAVGDALGAPVEGAKPGAIKNTYRSIDDYVDPEKILGRGKIYRWRKPGFYTDDTQQAIAILDSLLQDRGLNPEKAAERISLLAKGAEFQFGVYRGAGGNFRQSITAIRQGTPWTGSGYDTAGNGAATRVAPIALYYFDNEDLMADAAVRVSLFTHKNPVGISAAVAVAYIISKLLFVDGTLPGDGGDLISDASKFCRRQEMMMKARYGAHLDPNFEDRLHLFSDALSGLSGKMTQERHRVEKWIASNANPHASNIIKRPTLGFALASVIYSIYLAVKFSGSFEMAVKEAVNSGGDADTVAAMTGAISGARNGLESIPEHWLTGLANRKQLTFRAESLAGRKWMKSRLEDLYEMEYGLTKCEHEERLSRMRKAGVEFPEKRKKDRMSTPEPIKEKFDAKQYKRQKKKLKEFMKYLPPDDPQIEWDD